MLAYFRCMRQICFWIIIVFLFDSVPCFSQPIEKRLDAAMTAFAKDPQLQHAIASLSVSDVTGKSVYHYNDQYGLAPASNMKVFTCIAALDLLGEKYRFQTEIGISGSISDSVLNGNLIITGNGDPTLGSWRYPQTKPDNLLKQLVFQLRANGINAIDGQVILDGSRFASNPIPGGWSWDDMGNYYGAGAWGLNWNENQYDIRLKPGKKEGEPVDILGFDPDVRYTTFVNELSTGAPGSGDNSLIFLPPYSGVAIIEGTVPAGASYTISGSLPEPFTPIIAALKQAFAQYNIRHSGGYQSSLDFALQKKTVPRADSVLFAIESPVLDSIVYMFMKKSINLYGEDFIKTFALTKTASGSTGEGVAILKQYWAARGIDSSALNIKDGSGLSAQTRVTTDALVKALLYAKQQPWFPAFYNSLPVVNGMHMKTGTISKAKAFSGYQTATNGKEYAFSIIVNNYDGSTGTVIEKMYKVLNELKK